MKQKPSLISLILNTKSEKTRLPFIFKTASTLVCTLSSVSLYHWRIQGGGRDAHPLLVQILSFSISFQEEITYDIPPSVADPDFPGGGGANPPEKGGSGRQHMISTKFPKNCMKLKKFGNGRGVVRPKFHYVFSPDFMKIFFPAKLGKKSCTGG